MLSVIDFERGERAKGEQAHQWGTVFQTALPLLLVIPRLRLGIYNHGENCCLEDSTSHRAKHPRQSVKSVFEKKLGGGETNTDSTDFIRDGVLSEKEFQHTTFRYPLNKSGMVTTAWITSE